PMAALTTSYGIETPKDAEEKSIAEWLGGQLGAAATRGDRVPLGGVDLIVRAVSDNVEGKIIEVGLSLDPEGERKEPRVVGPMRRFLAGPRTWIRRAPS
ncbi:MAG: potassium/proton antiporter, partial [Rhodospirillum sp.]|nr:potassium/proton antiporter [Rhodospirillum sp.]